MEMLEKIERYSKGKMSADEIQAFELEISKNEELKEQVELSSLVDEIIIVNETWKLREQMQLDLNRPNKLPVKYIYALLLLISAILAILVIFRPAQKSLPEKKPFNKKMEDRAIIKSKEVITDSVFSGVIIKEEKNNFKVKINSNNTLELIKQNTIAEVPVIKEDSITPFKSSQYQQQIFNVTTDSSITAIIPDSCRGLKGEVEYFTTPSCQDENTGEVIIDIRSVQGGTKPYTFKLGNNVSTSRFDHLSAGTYNLIITDVLGCVAERSKSIVVTEKVCKTDHHVFNPQYDNYWPIPYNTLKTPVKFTIYDQNGQVIYNSIVQDFLPAEWRGELNRGGEISIGLYLFTIEYADGTIKKGSITITK